jgi:ABC-type transport system substrate-binding protein
VTRKQSMLDTLHTMRPQDRTFFHNKLSRRTVLAGGATAAAGYAVGGLFSGAAALPMTALAGNNVFQDGTPPADAAPPENQVLRVVGDPGFTKVLDFYEKVYERPSSSDLFSLPLVQLNRNFEIIPSAATEWSSNEDGTVWTFKLREDMMWNDGNPVTAADYVRTFQYSADPEHAWDFTWFWSGNILNYAEAVAGEVPLEEIGVRQGENEYEVVFETTESAPYLVSKLLYSTPLSAAALDEHGPLYNTNPETQVSSGPFQLAEWARDERIVYTRNESFTQYPVMLEKIIIKLAAPSTAFTLYEADQVDYVVRPAPAELQIMESDPETAKQIYQGVGDFACLYFFFDVNTAPFDDLKVRQAFSHVIDRDAIQQQILGNQAKSAPSFLAPGFPASNTEELASIQNFDPELGKQLLAEAGYPDGEGFPNLTMTVRGGAVPVEEATTQAYAAMLKEHLNINVELQTIDRQAFYDAMNAKPTEILFGWVSYGMDYFDPSNMLSVWLTGGRHSWSNEEYDQIVNEATTSLEDEETRTAMFQDAERILVEDVPAVWAYFETPIQLVKPYIIGPGLEADVNGITAVHWPEFVGFGTAIEEIYISADAPTGRE